MPSINTIFIKLGDWEPPKIKFEARVDLKMHNMYIDLYPISTTIVSTKMGGLELALKLDGS